MYAVVYHYKIKKSSLVEWKKTMRKADTLYKKHGDKCKEWLWLIKEGKSHISMINIGLYKSKKDYMTIEKKVGKDKSFAPLLKAFKRTLYNKKVLEEGFELISI